jgi:hypothetical protein
MISNSYEDCMKKQKICYILYFFIMLQKILNGMPKLKYTLQNTLKKVYPIRYILNLIFYKLISPPLDTFMNTSSDATVKIVNIVESAAAIP